MEATIKEQLCESEYYTFSVDGADFFLANTGSSGRARVPAEALADPAAQPLATFFVASVEPV